MLSGQETACQLLSRSVVALMAAGLGGASAPTL
jgi:hypothetical protein